MRPLHAFKKARIISFLEECELRFAEARVGTLTFLKKADLSVVLVLFLECMCTKNLKRLFSLFYMFSFGVNEFAEASAVQSRKRPISD